MEASDYAVMLLARREYSRAELKERMIRREYALEQIEAVLNDLIEHGLQSDERFAEMFVRSHIMRRQGARRISMDLRMRGVEQQIVQHVLAEADVDWFALACDALVARFKAPADDLKAKARQQRFLASRGFDASQCWHALECAWQDE